MSLSVRSYGAADAAAILPLLLSVFRAGGTYAIDPDISPAEALAYWTSPEHRVFVAERAGRVLGTYYLRRNQKGGGSHVCNCGYITALEARGQGVARAMLAHSLDTARQLGFRAMQFNFVLASNTRAVETWRRAGFEAIGRVPDAFLHPELGYVDALVMYRSLL